MSKYILIPDLETLKKEICSEKKEHFFRLVEESNRYFNIPNFNEPPKESTTYLSQIILNLSLTYLLTKEKKYLDEALRFIKNICAFPYWGNAHLVNVDLSASWILFGLSLSYNYLKEFLSENDRKMIENKLLYQSIIMRNYINEHEESWPSHYFQNHNWINYTGLAMTGYVLKDNYPEVKEYIDIAKENFEKVFSYLPDDGSDYEGVTYWRYGVYWLFLYADLLRDQEGIDLFSKSRFLQNTFDYRLYQSSSEMHKQLNFGDCHDRYSCNSSSLYYKIANEYNNGYAQKLGNLIFNNHLYEEQYQSKIKPGILKEAWLNLLWYNPEIKEKKLERLKKVKYFKDLGLITIRDGFSSDSMVFSFKCGCPGGRKQWKVGTEYYKNNKKWILSLSHHHPDNLSYILTYGKDYLVIDDGYNRNIMPHHHNVLLVDNKYSDVDNKNDIYLESVKKRIQKNKNYNISNYRGRIEYFFNKDDITCFKANNYKIYPLKFKMKEVSRTVFTNDLRYIVFIDKFKSKNNHIYQSVLNLDNEIVSINNDKHIVKGIFNSLNYYLFSNDEFIIKKEVNEVKSIMTTQEPNNYCYTKLHTFIVENKKETKEYELIELFARKDENISYFKDYIKINDNEFILLKDAFNFSYDGDLLYIKKCGNGKIEITLINGSYVKYKNKLIIELPHKSSIKKGDIDAILE